MENKIEVRIEISYDEEFGEYLMSKDITPYIVRREITKFVNEKLEWRKFLNSHFRFTFTHTDGKPYDLYGDMNFENGIYKFKVELLGVLIKRVMLDS